MSEPLRYREPWALWTVQKKLFVQSQAVWVELDEIPDLRSKPDAFVRLLQDLRRLEADCLREGIVGWISANAKGNEAMRKTILLVGATKYGEDDEFEYFKKVAGHPTLPTSVMDAYRRTRAQHGREAHA